MVVNAVAKPLHCAHRAGDPKVWLALVRKILNQDPGLSPQMSDPKSQIWGKNVRGFWCQKCPHADRVGPGGPKNVLFSDICSKKSQKIAKNRKRRSDAYKHTTVLSYLLGFDYSVFSSSELLKSISSLLVCTSSRDSVSFT